MRYEVGRWLRLRVWRPASRIAETFHLLPPLAATVLFLLLASIGQLHEIYFSYLEELDPLHIALAAVGFGLLSTALYVSHYSLTTARIDIIFSNLSDPHVDHSLRRVRNFAAWTWAFLPWAGLGTGLFLSGAQLAATHKKIGSAIARLDVAFQDSVARQLAEMQQLAVLAGRAGAVVMVAGLSTALLLHTLRRSRKLHLAAVSAIAALIVAAAVLPHLAADPIAVYRLMGPLATLSLVAVFFYSSVALLAFLSRKSGFPVLMLAILGVGTAVLFSAPIDRIGIILAAVFLLFAILALLSRQLPMAAFSILIVLLAGAMVLREWRQDDGAPTSGAPDAATQGQALIEADLPRLFKDWLENRKDRAQGRPYPVFIVAAQGGGIYAAAAATAFLAQLQDRCPAFGRHVFAISGVSGGAVGAAVYQAITRSQQQHASSGCRKPQQTSPLSDSLRAVMLADHFSPVVGAVVPDFLGASMNRAKALELSFIQALAAKNADAARWLETRFVDHWLTTIASPSLVLNTTWVETGYRAAFAPYSLAGVGDGTLYSFFDKRMLGETLIGTTLIQAAIVSARFPGILPAYSKLKLTTGLGQVRWNFVDGGYSDASGASTALDLYRTLEDEAKKLNVDLKVILLTNASPSPDFTRFNGTVFLDTIAPIDAILNVRSRLAEQSVARAVNYLGKPQSGTKSGTAEWKHKVVELDHETFSLPLGWKISKTSHGIVSLSVGRSELCPTAEAPVPAGPESEPEGISTRILKNNSCAVRAIENLLNEASQAAR